MTTTPINLGLTSLLSAVTVTATGVATGCGVGTSIGAVTILGTGVGSGFVSTTIGAGTAEYSEALAYSSPWMPP